MASSTEGNVDPFADMRGERPIIEIGTIGGTEYISLPNHTFAPAKFSDSQAYDICRICQGNGCAQCTWGNSSNSNSSESELSSSEDTPQVPDMIKPSKMPKPKKKKPAKKRRSNTKRTSRAEMEEIEEQQAEELAAIKKQRVVEKGDVMPDEENPNYLVIKGPSDAYWADELNDETDDDEKNFFPAIDPVTAEMDQLIVNMRENNNCFACSYDELTNSGVCFPSVFKNKWESFVKCALEALRNIPSMKIVGKQLYQAFIENVLVREPTYNDKGEPEMIWSEYSIIEHFREHNIDPCLQIHFLSQNILEQLRTVNRTQMYVQHKVSGRKKVVDKSVDTQGKLINQLALLWKLKPNELYGANPNRSITEAPNPMLNSRRKVVSESISIFRKK